MRHGRNDNVQPFHADGLENWSHVASPSSRRQSLTRGSSIQQDSDHPFSLRDDFQKYCEYVLNHL